ncbi:hypothetical protein NDI56_03620 [Haloarcula sp. S1CR25-12]|uniref:Right-handed parallel beta-helix repeat-containing protein n=1 Tax=Haloarcula saliterrae TaxID=2950534 RepID=A0ABU2F9B5_9EURY|nr:hypothetical protein [Haloarcula sp. S1CR25-12]MDS0258498.1 hypothetical protein [Haloarcula sp. S1CR25-12]
MTPDWTRRQLVSRLGGVALLGALAGCPSPDAPDIDAPPGPDGGAPRTEPPAGQRDRPVPSAYDSVVDITEAGADPEGEESIVSTLSDIDTDNTLVRFPPGTYHMDDTWGPSGAERLGLYGPEATITTVEEFTGPLFSLGTDSEVKNLFVGGFTFDFTPSNTGPRPINASVRRNMRVSNVTVRGALDLDQDGMRFGVSDADGTGLVWNMRLPDGGDPEYKNTGCYVGENHVGTLVFQNCRINGFPDNGLYASPAKGRVNVVGGRYLNSGVSNIRVSGPSTVKGVIVRCDESRDGIENMRGIRLRGGRDIVVENSRLVFDSVTSSDGAITCAEWLDAATVRNTHITVHADDVAGIRAKPPNGSGQQTRTHPIQIRNVRIDGSANSGAAVRISERAGTLLSNLCICQHGADRDGIVVSDASGTTVRGSNISVSGQPLATEGRSITRKNLSLQSTQTGDRSCSCTQNR